MRGADPAYRISDPYEARCSAIWTPAAWETTSTASSVPPGRSADRARTPRTSCRRPTPRCSRPRILRNEDDLGYLLRAMRNVFLSGRRTASRRPVTTTLPEDGGPAATRTDADPAAALSARLVYEAVAALPPDYRDTVVAVDVLGLSYREAASALKIPEGTVMSRLQPGTQPRRRRGGALEPPIEHAHLGRP